MSRGFRSLREKFKVQSSEFSTWNAIDNAPAAQQRPLPFGGIIHPETSQPSNEKHKAMGDKSPKANQKKSSQKQSKASSADQKKKQIVAAAQASTKKK